MVMEKVNEEEKEMGHHLDLRIVNVKLNLKTCISAVILQV